MGPKRQADGMLKVILDWDKTATDKIVKYVDQKYGPLSKHEHTFKRLELSCHGIPWLICVGAAIFFFESDFVRHLSVNLLIALLVDIIIVAIVKAITRRRRPSSCKDDMLVAIYMDKFSFPSGHATRAVMLGLLIPMQYSAFVGLTPLLVLWSSCVCISRVLLRRHHILDVFGGIGIGVIEAFIIGHYFWLAPSSAQAVVAYFMDETQVGPSYDV